MVHKPFEEFTVGDRATFRKTFTDADIVLFVGVSGDTYPLHVDDTYAQTTRFGKRVVHGMLTASLLSTTAAMVLSRPGGIFVSQSLRFLRPVFPGDTIEAATEVVEIDPKKRRLLCKSTCTNQHGKLVIDGDAVLQKDAE